jgi:uncharacterized protein YukE
MSKAVVDPGELRQFARDLKRFNTELAERARLMQARFAALSQTWRDQEQRKFAEEFEQIMRALARFTKVSDEHVPFLLRKADRIDEYLDQR